MRGRKPRPMILKKRDEQELRLLLRHGNTPLRVARRARILLARSKKGRVEHVADIVEQDRATVWRVCERYKSAGLQAALYDAPRSGRPPVFFQDNTQTD